MYLSVKEAAELTGKSATTIYRLCNKRINTEYVKKEDSKFYIDKEFLLATYPLEQPADKKSSEKEVAEIIVKQPIDDIIETDASEEKVELVYEMQRSTKNLDEEINVVDEAEEIETATNIDFTHNKVESFYTNLAKPDVMIGVLASLLVISLFVFLLSLYAN